MTILNRLKSWLNDHTVLQCARCRRWLFYKDARCERHTAAGLVWLCQECHDEVYSYRIGKDYSPASADRSRQ